MKPLALATVAALLVAPALAEERRELGAHQHGVGLLNLAFEGTEIVMELRAPGADIVGFEHAATSAEDRAAIDLAVAALARPLELFVMPDAAQCAVTHVSAQLVEEDREEHAGDHHEDARHGHADHGDDVHPEHEQDGAKHTEFHAEYSLACADPAAITRIGFAYFDTFPNARELDVQLVSDKGAQVFEVEREALVLDLEGLI